MHGTVHVTPNQIGLTVALSPRFLRCLLASGCQAFELRLALGRTWNQALHCPTYYITTCGRSYNPQADPDI